MGLLESRWPALVAWYRRLDDFWSAPALRPARIPRLSRTFVETWLGLVFASPTSPQLQSLSDQAAARQLIFNREAQLKGSRARLENPRALERWTGNSGLQRLEYRWTITRSFARDIMAGLQAQERAHA